MGRSIPCPVCWKYLPAVLTDEVQCEVCDTFYHKLCWQKKGCVTYGCERRENEMPVSAEPDSMPASPQPLLQDGTYMAAVSVLASVVVSFTLIVCFYSIGQGWDRQGRVYWPTADCKGYGRNR